MSENGNLGLPPVKVETIPSNSIQSHEATSFDNCNSDTINTEQVIMDDNNKEVKKKDEIKVGVGGLFITKLPDYSNDIDFVLMYKRYKNPEINQWSLLGGHVDLYQTCEDTLKEKIYHLTSHRIQKRDIEVLDVIHTVNHFDEEERYHYVSPQYYVDIKQTEFEKIETTHRLNKNSEKIIIISTYKQLKKTMNADYNSISSEERPWLSLISLNVFDEINRDSRTRLEDYFIHTTVEAIFKHLELQKNIHSIVSVTNYYKQWKKT